MSLENKKCLIIGGSGFIGINASLHLKSKGVDVSVLDALSNCYINATSVLVENNIPLFIANSLDIDYMIKVLDGFDFVINLSSSNIIDDGFTLQETLADSSILSTQILMQAATRHNVSRIIIVSNLHVYGETKPYRSKCKEDMKLNPICPLGSIKLSEELIAKTLAEAYSQKITILRIGECYGPYIKTHMPYGFFTAAAFACMTGSECTLPNDGLDGRDYIYVKDVCNYIEKILDNCQEKTVETYNVCSGNEKTFLDIFNLMKDYYKNEETKTQDRMVIYPFAGHIVGDNSRINKKFGKHYTPFEESFNETLSWVKEQFNVQKNMIQNAKGSIEKSKK